MEKKIIGQFKNKEGTVYTITETDISERIPDEKFIGCVIPAISKESVKPVEIITLSEAESEWLFSIKLFNKLLNQTLSEIFNKI